MSVPFLPVRHPCQRRLSPVWALSAAMARGYLWARPDCEYAPHAGSLGALLFSVRHGQDTPHVRGQPTMLAQAQKQAR